MLPCIALRDNDQAYKLEIFLKIKKQIFTAVCFHNNLWESIWFQAFMLSLVFAFLCVYILVGEGGSKMSLVLGYHSICLRLHPRYNVCVYLQEIQGDVVQYRMLSKKLKSNQSFIRMILFLADENVLHMNAYNPFIDSWIYGPSKQGHK